MVNLFITASEFARKAHGDQKYGDEPYSVHLDEVDAVLLEFGYNSSGFRAVGQLHDVLEDTDTTEKQLRSIFPQDVCDIVVALSKHRGLSRKESAPIYYRQIVEQPKAVIVKLADRIANVRHGLKTGSSLVDMYRKEHPAFRAALYSIYEDLMWTELDFLFGVKL
jgi:guanosine-3',5'-bis(diphosphate) 3'-pyrophosphohydrolase